MVQRKVKRGDVYYADLSPVIGSEQGGVRPVLILQNDVGNHYSPTVIIAAITAQMQKKKMPTHVQLKGADSPLTHDSVILMEQLRTIDKQRLKDKIAHLSPVIMTKVDRALTISVGLNTAYDASGKSGLTN
ncbi:type II toxin-antitoxin system PemK/MazF family toxin [Limosilactobacillus caccae]|uniref:type II toxin-antitoxin system PemK/MazF family toxin n=1 Tax=Limosilactobacillus caccae TaxID=1926284 RepID=UPI000970628F|nr:type II toxin-antitoxin system PemK/MazF family toxin [Limosilactobacillus caccae]